MSFKPTLPEDCLDPWLAVEPDPGRRENVIRFLMALCDAEGLGRRPARPWERSSRRSPRWSLEPASWSCG